MFSTEYSNDYFNQTWIHQLAYIWPNSLDFNFEVLSETFSNDIEKV